MTSFSKQCSVLCLAQKFSFDELGQQLLATKRAQLFKDALLIDHKDGISVVFVYGVVVHWNVSLDVRTQLHNELLEFALNPLMEIAEDKFNYQLNAGRNHIHHDKIELLEDDDKTVLAVSHAMAQSIKLAVFERKALDTITSTQHLPKTLASTGEIHESKKELAKIRGQLFLTKSDINLNYDLLDTPEFFWEHPEYQSIYTLVANYLEISPRTEVLTKKLETIHELLEMLADEQKHQHSSTLEWIIIWLIAVEIGITLLEKIL